MKKYIKVKENTAKTTHLKIELYYSLGGMNYYNYKTEKRGYYLSVTPVELADRGSWRSEGWTFGTGYKKMIKEVKRQSKKAAAEAEAKYAEHLNALIEAVCQQCGLELAEAV